MLLHRVLFDLALHDTTVALLPCHLPLRCVCMMLPPQVLCVSYGCPTTATMWPQPSTT
jgi:hypothetical protein